MSDFNELIERIRKEEVTLFIGSGFSLKAGGPKSSVLVESKKHQGLVPVSRTSGTGTCLVARQAG